MARQDIDAVNTRLIEAVEKWDAAAIASLYAPDARVMPPSAPAVTGQSIQELWQSLLDMGLNGGALTTVSLEDLGDLAIEVGRYELRIADTVDVGKYVVVHRRQPDGSWRLGVDIWNSDRPAPAA